MHYKLVTAIQCANKQELYEQSHTNSKSQSGKEILKNLLNILQTTWETVVEKITGLLRHGKKTTIELQEGAAKILKIKCNLLLAPPLQQVVTTVGLTLISDLSLAKQISKLLTTQ